jgi:Tol biopolymer transport system component
MKMFSDCKIGLVLFGFVTSLVLGGGGSAKVDFTFGTPTNLGMTVNSSASEFDPSISADGLELYFISYRPGGQGQTDMWVTTRKTKADPWGTPVNLGPTVNSSANDNAPGISADGLSLYFSSDRPGGYGDWDLWVTTRKTTSDPWGTPVNLGPTVNGSASDHAPSISADGLTLYFAGYPRGPMRPGGLGDSDIWMTTRNTKADPWSTPVNLGPTVNTSGYESGPCISADGLALYLCRGWPRRLWVAMRKTKADSWGTPVDLGSPLNSPDWLNVDPCISSDGSTLYFASTRPGALGGPRDFDIWQARMVRVVDH